MSVGNLIAHISVGSTTGYPMQLASSLCLYSFTSTRRGALVGNRLAYELDRNEAFCA
jgi:hypothetical protein